jgi:hypothetical protein
LASVFLDGLLHPSLLEILVLREQMALSSACPFCTASAMGSLTVDEVKYRAPSSRGRKKTRSGTQIESPWLPEVGFLFCGRVFRGLEQHMQVGVFPWPHLARDQCSSSNGIRRPGATCRGTEIHQGL